jgi:hypothetical protein
VQSVTFLNDYQVPGGKPCPLSFPCSRPSFARAFLLFFFFFLIRIKKKKKKEEKEKEKEKENRKRKKKKIRRNQLHFTPPQ